MGSPYNHLQQLVFAYSGREIGVDKFKPYTFGNEKAEINLAVYGSMLQIPLDSSRVKNSLSSGSFAGMPSDNANFKTNPSGQISSSPSDVEKVKIGITGIKDGHPRDLNRFLISVSGEMNRPQGDTFSRVGFYSISGYFKDEPKEISNLRTYQSGRVTPARIDACPITFLMFTGTYSSGLYVPPPQNYPITGVDAPQFTFVFFTGTYQGA